MKLITTVILFVAGYAIADLVYNYVIKNHQHAYAGRPISPVGGVHPPHPGIVVAPPHPQAGTTPVGLGVGGTPPGIAMLRGPGGPPGLAVGNPHLVGGAVGTVPVVTPPHPGGPPLGIGVPAGMMNHGLSPPPNLPPGFRV